MKYCLFFIFLFSISVTLFCQIDLSLKLEKGQTYHKFTNNLTTIIESEGGSEVRTITTEKGGFSFKVLEDRDSIYLMETRFIHFSLKVETADGVTFNSSEKDDPTDVMSTILRKFVNKPFKVLMRKDYTWKETYGLDSIFLHSTDDYGLSPVIKHQVDSVMLAGVKDMSRVDAALTAVLYGSKKMFPAEVWTSQYITEHVVPTKDSCTYYLAETTGDYMTIKGTGFVESLKDQSIDAGTSTVYDLQGNIDIVAKYNKSTHWIREAMIKTEISGKAESISIETKTEKKTVPIRIITQATITDH